MNILFLNGSPRKTGYTVQVMKLIEQGIDAKHVTEWVHAYDLTIKPCQCCVQCRPKYECKMPIDDGHSVWHKIHVADALVIGSPTYYGNISGPLKILFDRNLTAFEEMPASGLEAPTPLHKGQKTALVTACNIPFPMSRLPNQGMGTIHALETVMKAGGYTIVGSIIADGSASIKTLSAKIRDNAAAIGIALVK